MEYQRQAIAIMLLLTVFEFGFVRMSFWKELSKVVKPGAKPTEEGAALRCHNNVGDLPATTTCEGSCKTIIVGEVVVLSCADVEQADRCTDMNGGGKVCYCNTDLCNKDTTSGSGAALRCHNKILGFTETTTTTCEGSCKTFILGEAVALSCADVKQADGCEDALFGKKVCYCNTDLCNKDPTSGSGTHTFAMAMLLSIFMAKLVFF